MVKKMVRLLPTNYVEHMSMLHVHVCALVKKLVKITTKHSRARAMWDVVSYYDELPSEWLLCVDN